MSIEQKTEKILIKRIFKLKIFQQKITEIANLSISRVLKDKMIIIILFTKEAVKSLEKM